MHSKSAYVLTGVQNIMIRNTHPITKKRTTAFNNYRSYYKDLANCKSFITTSKVGQRRGNTNKQRSVLTLTSELESLVGSMSPRILYLHSQAFWGQSKTREVKGREKYMLSHSY